MLNYYCDRSISLIVYVINRFFNIFFLLCKLLRSLRVNSMSGVYENSTSLHKFSNLAEMKCKLNIRILI